MMVFGPERFSLHPDRDEVFSWLMCNNLPCSAAFDSEWDDTAVLLRASIEPHAAMLRDTDTAMTVFLTLGPQAEAQITRLFESQRYVQASLLNTMCDEMLFQMDRQTVGLMEDVLAPERLHIAARMEPVVDLSPEEMCRLSRPLSDIFPYVRVSPQGMLFPTKSMMYCVSLSADGCGQHALHDCSRCSQKDCLYRSGRS